MKNKGKTLKTLLLAGALASCLFNTNPLIAKEQNPKPKIELTLNSEIEIPREGVEYYDSFAYFNRDNNSLIVGENSTLTPEEITGVENILKDVKNGNIHSYSEFLQASAGLSEEQKVILFAAIGGGLMAGSYDYSYPDNPVFSQNDYFSSWQNYLQTGNKNLLGVCRHLASNLEQTANDMGIRASAVTGTSRGGGHAYVLLKLKDGTAIVDYSGILDLKTKNIEKVLDTYQKYLNSIAFQHLFFEDTQFKYRLITKDGKNFLRFIGYDESSDTLKDSLIHDDKPSADITCISNIDTYQTSVELNLLGFFEKVGEIRGDSLSPMDKMIIAQAGYKNKFLIADFIRMSHEYSVVIGSPVPGSKMGIWGINGSLMIGTKRQEGLNFNSRIAADLVEGEHTALFNDALAEVGLSYSVPITDKFKIESYLTSQFALFPTDIGPYTYNPVLNECIIGTVFDINFPYNFNLSVDPYYSRKIWEHEFGANIKLKNKNFELDLEGSLSRSAYDFCPNKYNIGTDLSFNIKNFKFDIGYKDKITDYGEIENNHSFSLKADFKY
jgi:hypothetical protein